MWTRVSFVLLLLVISLRWSCSTVQVLDWNGNQACPARRPVKENPVEPQRFEDVHQKQQNLGARHFYIVGPNSGQDQRAHRLGRKSATEPNYPMETCRPPVQQSKHITNTNSNWLMHIINIRSYLHWSNSKSVESETKSDSNAKPNNRQFLERLRALLGLRTEEQSKPKPKIIIILRHKSTE